MTFRDFDEKPRVFETARVLVAEDNTLNQALVSCYFEQFGCAVDLAEDGAAAIRLFQQNRYDIVFMDCQMPNLNGIEATRKIREFEGTRPALPQVPIIALTASMDDEDREACTEAGMNGWLSKPFTLEQLYASLDRWVGDGAAGGEFGGGCDMACLEAGSKMTECPATEAEASVCWANVINPAVLDALRAIQSPKNPNVLSLVVETYISSATMLMKKLSAAIAAGDMAAMASVAHSLKSSSANVGAMGLSELCRDLERAAHGEGRRSISDLHERVREAFAPVCAALVAEIDNTGRDSTDN